MYLLEQSFNCHKYTDVYRWASMSQNEARWNIWQYRKGSGNVWYTWYLSSKNHLKAILCGLWPSCQFCLWCWRLSTKTGMLATSDYAISIRKFTKEQCVIWPSISIFLSTAATEGKKQSEKNISSSRNWSSLSYRRNSSTYITKMTTTF